MFWNGNTAMDGLSGKGSSVGEDCDVTAGLARVDLGNPENGTHVSLWVDQNYPYLMLFTGDSLATAKRRSLAVEPMTCPPNAFRSGVALIRLEPSATFTGTWGITHGRERRR